MERLRIFRLMPGGVTPAIVAGLNRLLPVLSSRAQPITAQYLGEIIASPSRVYIAVWQGVIVGSCTLVVQLQLAKRRGWIEDVVVDQSMQGHGVGRALMIRALDDAPPNLKLVDLTTTPDRRAAHNLYESLGFERRNTDVYRLDMNAWRQRRAG